MNFKSLLLDLGPAVAFLDLKDPKPRWVTRELSGFTGQLRKTTAVVTEVMHLGQPDEKGRRDGATAEFLRSTRAGVHGFSRPSEIPVTAAPTEQY